MAVVTDNRFPQGYELIQFDDGTSGLIEEIAVTGLTSGTADGQRAEAIAATGYGMTSTYALSGVTLRVITIAAKIVAKGSALVTVNWGINDSPILDGTGDDMWIAETYSEILRDPVGLDVNGAPITVKYQPATMADAQWNEAWNQLRYNRGITVPGYHVRGHVILRRQVSKSTIDTDMIALHPRIWANKYVGWVNNAIAQDSPLPAVPKGVFLCTSMRAYTRNRGESYFIEAEFTCDKRGFDPVLMFVDGQTGTVPGDIVVDAGMKTAWPTVRATAAKPYGASRPQLVRGSATFSTSLIGINLAKYYAV